ncbi:MULTISPECIES: type VII secretion target [Actinosynnema]|uniref:type VII secretion target n=1 Tax=Actinosynnema TaxID=40566 RepID=UPI0020A48D3E|nr:type VII secretion target [Actinosynnema pretiosum]MCP2097922.1 Excreted virulence factor EspC, type VII ESX diderm [Actinosynnema pretiosum]
MSGGGYEVVTGQLEAFAEAQDGRGGEVGAAAGKAGGVSLGGETFGVLLSFFANGAESAAAEVVEGIERLAAAYGEAAGDTRATAAEYAAVEDGNAAGFGGEG